MVHAKREIKRVSRLFFRSSLVHRAEITSRVKMSDSLIVAAEGSAPYKLLEDAGRGILTAEALTSALKNGVPAATCDDSRPQLRAVGDAGGGRGQVKEQDAAPAGDAG